MERKKGIPVDIRMDTGMKRPGTDETERDSYSFKGKLFNDEDLFLLRFMQDDVSVSVKIKNDIITVTRKGPFESKMVFDKNKVTETIYDTPQGSISMSIETSYAEKIILTDCIRIKMKYSISSEGIILGEYKMLIEISG